MSDGSDPQHPGQALVVGFAMTIHDSRSIRINSSWMMAEQIGRQAISLLLTIWIARVLGPDGMGRLSFALSLYALFGIVTTLGLNRILVREFSSNIDSRAVQDLISTALAMRMASSALMAIIAVTCCALLAPMNLALVAILVLGYFFTAFDLVDLLFQSKLRSREVARVRIFAFAASSAIKAALLLQGAGLKLIALACLLDWVFVGSALAWLYFRESGGFSLNRPVASLARQLFAESKIEIIAGFSGLAFMKIDQIMLQVMRDSSEVAIMAVSSRLTEAWYFIPAAIVSSTFPIIVRLKDSAPQEALRRLQALYRTLVMLAVAAGLAVTLVANHIVRILYGPDYAAAAQVLIIQTWCGLFMSLGIASGIWLMANRLGLLNLRRNLFGALINIILNLWLIPRYGAIGAAWATLAAFASAYLIYDFLDPALRDIGRAKLRALMLR
jgi:PST family polysaccharide transporter